MKTNFSNLPQEFLDAYDTEVWGMLVKGEPISPILHWLESEYQ